MIYFEDLSIGQKIKIGPISVTEKEIIEFAKKYDPQPFHIDKNLAKYSLPSLQILSSSHEESAFTTDTPTP